MAIQAVVFDIGGVLEITPDLGVTRKWEQHLQLAVGELDKRLDDVWRGGSIGTISEQDVHRGIREIMGMSTAQVDAFMQDNGLDDDSFECQQIALAYRRWLVPDFLRLNHLAFFTSAGPHGRAGIYDLNVQPPRRVPVGEFEGNMARGGMPPEFMAASGARR